MTSITESGKCTGCAACANSCPLQCITMLPDTEGFPHPQIDQDKCVDCRKCVAVCPVQHDAAKGYETEPSVYAAYATDKNIVEHSSSGGVFFVLAEHVIQMGGVVFGAAFDTPTTVHHIAVRDEKSLCKLRGSKYVQSEIGLTYREAEIELHKNKTVLFSGTPCQISGLRHYLRREYDNLICIDIICHSIPSPKAWKAFVDETSVSVNSNISSVNFRDKRDNWENYCLSFQLENGKEYVLKGDKNLYMQAFIGGLSTRQCCSQCTFKGKNHESDITLGDYWGVRFVQNEAYNARGTSLVIVNTEKGRAMLDLIRDRLVLHPSSMDMALPPNPAYSKPSVQHPRRALFFTDLDSVGVYHSIETSLPPTKKEKFILAVRHSFPYRAVTRLARIIAGK